LPQPGSRSLQLNCVAEVARLPGVRQRKSGDFRYTAAATHHERGARPRGTGVPPVGKPTGGTPVPRGPARGQRSYVNRERMPTFFSPHPRPLSPEAGARGEPDSIHRTGYQAADSFTMLNQKCSIDLTTPMNCSRSTGLVT